MDASWTNADHVSYHIFCEQLSAQMLQYDASKRLYPGDKLIPVSKNQPTHDYPGQQTKYKIAPNADGTVSVGQYLAAKKGGKKA